MVIMYIIFLKKKIFKFLFDLKIFDLNILNGSNQSSLTLSLVKSNTLISNILIDSEVKVYSKDLKKANEVVL
jgi:hypothetical protein